MACLSVSMGGSPEPMQGKPEVVVHRLDPTCEEVEAGDHWALLDAQPTLHGQIQANERLCLKHQGG